MNTKTLFKKRGLMLASILFFAGVFAVQAAETMPNITFPIQELGGCEDQSSCRAYCSLNENHQVCQDFAKSHGLGDAAKKQEEINNAVQDGGPGNCALGSEDPEVSCRSYCSLQDHIRECVAYGKEHNLLKGDELSEAEKVIQALDNGATLPEGCTDQESCKNLCEDPPDTDTAKQCFDFADKAGLLPPGVDKERAEKTFQLIQEGKAPFKSLKDFKQCDNPPNDEVLQKCISFGEENGLISPEDAKIIKETGGKGPGGCSGKDQCDAYCQENQDECFKFAKEHNLLKPEDQEKIANGVNMMRQGFENAPKDVKQCMIEAIGQETLDNIFSGEELPSPKIGDAMKTCFESMMQMNGNMGPPPNGMMHEGEDGQMLPPFGGQGDENGFQGQGFQATGANPQFTPEVKGCIVSKVGQEGLDSLENPQGQPPDQSLGTAIRDCFMELDSQRSGPGGCTTKEECEQFCSDPANISECGGSFDAAGNMMQEGQYMQNGQYPNDQHPPEGDDHMMMPPPPYNDNQQFRPEDGQMMPPPPQGFNEAGIPQNMTEEEKQRLMDQYHEGDGYMPPYNGQMMPPPDGMMMQDGGQMPPPPPDGSIQYNQTLPPPPQTEPATQETQPVGLLNMLSNLTASLFFFLR